MSSLGEEYPKEQARCRELLAEYKALPAASGWFGAAAIEQVLQNADKAASEGDVVHMLYCFERMKECQ